MGWVAGRRYTKMTRRTTATQHPRGRRAEGSLCHASIVGYDGSASVKRHIKSVFVCTTKPQRFRGFVVVRRPTPLAGEGRPTQPGGAMSDCSAPSRPDSRTGQSHDHEASDCNSSPSNHTAGSPCPGSPGAQPLLPTALERGRSQSPLAGVRRAGVSPVAKVCARSPKANTCCASLPASVNAATEQCT